MGAQLGHDVSGSARFRAEHRVKSSRDYARSRAEGRRASSAAFAMEVTRNAAGSRLGLVVSRRVGGAVQRNRAKRIVREWFRRNREGLPVIGDFVVIARSGAARLPAAEAWRELSALAARAAR